MSTTPLHLVHRRAIRRTLAVAGLLGIALVHLLDLPGKVHETPWMAVLYVGLIVSALVLAEMLVRKDDRRAWAGTLGLASLFLEGVVAAVAALALAEGDPVVATDARQDALVGA